MKFYKNKKWIYFLLIVIFMAIFLWERSKLSENLNSLETDLPANHLVASNANFTNALSSEEKPPVSEDLSLLNKNDPLMKWLKDEAALLDQNNQHNVDKEIILKKIASEFTLAQIKFLSATATTVKATANERILATYLLTLINENSSENSLAALAQVAQTPLSLTSPQPAHSLAESSLMQEKAIRIMAIDELFTRYENDAITKEDLKNALDKITEPTIRQYAMKRWAELN